MFICPVTRGPAYARVETIKGCPATTSFLAKLITDKYQFHLPIERQVVRLKMMGMDISKCTLNFWMKKAISKLKKLMPLWKRLTLYIDHGDWSIDNNTAERSMRPLAVGKK